MDDAAIAAAWAMFWRETEVLREVCAKYALSDGGDPETVAANFGVTVAGPGTRNTPREPPKGRSQSQPPGRSTILG